VVKVLGCSIPYLLSLTAFNVSTIILPTSRLRLASKHFFIFRKLNFVSLWPVVLHHHLRIHLLLRKHPLTSPLLSLLLNLKSQILFDTPNKQCDSDPIPTWLLKQCSALLVPTITSIVNLSLSSGNFQHTLKESLISPLIKKPTLDKDEISNYLPISNLSLISQIIERVVKSRLSDHLTSNNLVNPHQSAYCKHRSTETALIYIHDTWFECLHDSSYLMCLFVCFLVRFFARRPAMLGLMGFSGNLPLYIIHRYYICVY